MRDPEKTEKRKFVLKKSVCIQCRLKSRGKKMSTTEADLYHGWWHHDTNPATTCPVEPIKKYGKKLKARAKKRLGDLMNRSYHICAEFNVYPYNKVDLLNGPIPPWCPYRSAHRK